MSEHGTTLGLLPPEPGSTVSARTWLVAALAVVLVAGIAALATLRRTSGDPGGQRPADPYAEHLVLGGIQVSEATNGTGGKATYVDGTIRNTGTRLLTGAAVQVLFASADGGASYRETLPLALVRTREPYVNLQPASAAPISPGEQREFRLIIDAVPANWDSKVPELRVVHTTLQ